MDVLPLETLHEVPEASTLLYITQGIADAAETQLKENPGLWDQWLNFITNSILNLANTLENLGVKESYGFGIVLFTIIVKTCLFPINYFQISSTTKMQVSGILI